MSKFRQSCAKTKLVVFTVIFSISVAFQVLYLFMETKPAIIDIWRDRGQSALWRGARFSQGQRFADFVLFILTKVPSDGLVILPPSGDGSRSLSTTAYMQFFLFPREVINITDVTSYQKLSQNNTYIIISGLSQIKALEKVSGERLMFDDSWGIIVPNKTHPNVEQLPQVFHSSLELIAAGFWPAVWLLFLTLIGYILVRRLVPDTNKIVQIAIGYGLSLGILSVVTTLISLVGISLNRNVILLIVFLLLVSALSLLQLSKDRQHAKRTTLKNNLICISKPDIWQLAILFLGLITAAISIGKGYHITDEIQTWGVKGYAIAFEGSIKNVASWGTNPWAYPLHIPILIAITNILFGDDLPASKIIFSGYYVCFVLLIYHLLKKRVDQPSIAGLSSIFIATLPIVFLHATIAYANMTLIFYLVIGIILFNQTFDLANQERSYPLAFLSGLFFTFASWTRPEGLVMSCLGIGLISGLSYYKLKVLHLRYILFALCPLVIYIPFWLWVKGFVYYQPVNNANLLSTALKQILSGYFNINESLYLLKATTAYLFDTKSWGIFGYVLIPVLALWIVTKFRALESPSRLVICGFFYVFIIMAMYYTTSYHDEFDISRWISTGLDRALMPGFILLWFGGIEATLG